MAIGREDGGIEIKTPLEKWCTLARVAGRKNFALRGLAWSRVELEKGRLFGISLRGFIFEVDLQALTVIRVTDSYGGAAWCMAANPGRSSELAVGCEDGSVRLFSYSDGRLDYRRALPNTGARVLSLAYHPTKPQLFIGGADGIIRCVNEKDGRSIFRMTGDLVRGSQTMIYSMAVLSDSTVFSGDNRGRLQVWDGNTGVLMSSIHQHTADVLAIAVSADENSVFASGVDSKVVCARRVSNEVDTVMGSDGRPEKRKRKVCGEARPSDCDWIFTNAMRPHTHDVYALAVCTATQYPPQPQATAGSSSDGGVDGGGPGGSNPPYSRHGNGKKGVVTKEQTPRHNKRARARTNSTDGTTYIARRYQCLLSGGLDTKLCAYSVCDFQRARPVWQLSVPARGLINSTKDGSLVAIQHASHMDLWLLSFGGSWHGGGGGNDGDGDDGATDSTDLPCKLGVRLTMASDAHIQCSALSDNGNYLAVSSATATQVWAVRRTGGSGSKPPSVELSEINIGECLRDVYAMCLTFSNSTGASVQLAAATTDGEIRLVSLGELSELEMEEMEELGGDDDDEDDDDDDEDDVDDDDSDSEGGGGSSSSDDSGDDDEDDDEDVSRERAKALRYTRQHSARLVHTFDHSNLLASRIPDAESASESGAQGKLVCAVASMNFSRDCAQLAVAAVGCRFCLYDLDQRRLSWVAPLLPSPVTSVAFHPASPTIVALLASNEFYSYDTETLQLTPWSQENSALIPAAVKALPRPLEGLCFDPNNPSVLFAFGQGCTVYVNLASSIPINPQVVGSCPLITEAASSPRSAACLVDASSPAPPAKTRKGKKGMDTPTDVTVVPSASGRSSNFAIITSYRSMVSMTCLRNSQLVRKGETLFCPSPCRWQQKPEPEIISSFAYYNTVRLQSSLFRNKYIQCHDRRRRPAETCHTAWLAGHMRVF
jgi:WD40 repeat protein